MKTELLDAIHKFSEEVMRFGNGEILEMKLSRSVYDRIVYEMVSTGDLAYCATGRNTKQTWFRGIQITSDKGE